MAQQPVDSVLNSMSMSMENAPDALLDSLSDRYTEKYLRENGNEEIYPLLGFTYDECKAKELNYKTYSTSTKRPFFLREVTPNFPDYLFPQSILKTLTIT